jgi:hypothetical protein
MRLVQLACFSLLLLAPTTSSAQDYGYEEPSFKRTRKTFLYPRIGGLNGEETNLALGLVAGAAINENLSAGIGFEYDNYTWGPVIPAFLALRLNASAGEVSPVFFFEFGYGKSFGVALDDGMYLGFGAGIEAFMTNRTAFHLDIGRRGQWHGSRGRDDVWATWAVMMGFSFDVSRQSAF